MKDSKTFNTDSKKSKKIVELRGPASSQFPLSSLSSHPYPDILPMPQYSHNRIRTLSLPYCHLSNIPITECCTAPLLYCHLSCADCPLSCCHLSCTVLPAQLLILYYASLAYCRPALYVIYQFVYLLISWYLSHIPALFCFWVFWLFM